MGSTIEYYPIVYLNTQTIDLGDFKHIRARIVCSSAYDHYSKVLNDIINTPSSEGDNNSSSPVHAQFGSFELILVCQLTYLKM